MTTAREAAELINDAIAVLERELDFNGPYTNDVSVLTDEPGLEITFEDDSIFKILISESS